MDEHVCEECGEEVNYEASVSDPGGEPVGGWYCYLCGHWERDQNIDCDETAYVA